MTGTSRKHVPPWSRSVLCPGHSRQTGPLKFAEATTEGQPWQTCVFWDVGVTEPSGNEVSFLPVSALAALVPFANCIPFPVRLSDWLHRVPGVVTVRPGVVIDREAFSPPFLELLLLAEDIGQLNGTAYLFVTILDDNDNWPTFSPPTYTVHLLENCPPGNKSQAQTLLLHQQELIGRGWGGEVWMDTEFSRRSFSESWCAVMIKSIPSVVGFPLLCIDATTEATLIGDNV